MLVLASCSTDPKISDVGNEGYFVTDTLENVTIQNYFEKDDTIKTMDKNYMILAKTPSFESRLVMEIPAAGETYVNKYITSVKVALKSAFYLGPDIDSVFCPVYKLTQDWEDNTDEIWNDLTSIVDYSQPIGYLLMTDSISNYDTLYFTDIDVFRAWQDTSTANYGFIVELPEELNTFEKSYETFNGFIHPDIVFTYKDSVNATEEKTDHGSIINDLFIFQDRTDQYFTDPGYYYLRSMKNNSLLINVDFSELQNTLDQNNGVILNAQLLIPFDVQNSFYSTKSSLKFGIYPLDEGWTPDSLAKINEFNNGSKLITLNAILDNYLTFTGDGDVQLFALNYVRGTLSGSVQNNGWVIEPYDFYKGYEVFAIPKYGQTGKIIVTYWVPPAPKY